MNEKRGKRLSFLMSILPVLVLVQASAAGASPVRSADIDGSVSGFWYNVTFSKTIFKAGSVEQSFFRSVSDSTYSCSDTVTLTAGSLPSVSASGTASSTYYDSHFFSAGLGEITYYIRADKIDPYAPNVDVPLLISSTGSCSASSYASAGCYSYFGTQNNPWEDKIIYSDSYNWHGTRTIRENVPIGETYAIYLKAGGGVTSSGSFSAFVDPMVQIDPDWLVYYNGDYVPGIQLYSLELSEGFSAVPLPGSFWLLGSGLLGLAGWRTFRKS